MLGSSEIPHVPFPGIHNSITTVPLAVNRTNSLLSSKITYKKIYVFLINPVPIYIRITYYIFNFPPPALQILIFQIGETKISLGTALMHREAVPINGLQPGVTTGHETLNSGVTPDTI